MAAAELERAQGRGLEPPAPGYDSPNALRPVDLVTADAQEVDTLVAEWWDALAKARWLSRCKIHYWGDIDTHGFGLSSVIFGLTVRSLQKY